MKVGIIGAGPAGLSCGLKLAQNGTDVTVFESSSIPGGMCKSFDLWDMRVDLGPHRFFSMDEDVTNFWLEPLKNEYVLVDRLTRIFYKNKFFNYPIKPADALPKLGIVEALHCGASYAATFFTQKGNEENFAQWVSSRFGKRLFEIFFKSYSEKLWGISCEELDASFASQRIKGLNLYETIKNAFNIGKNKHKTLVDQFAYPKMGAGQTYDLMAAKIESLGGKILYDTEVTNIDPENSLIYYRASGQADELANNIKFDHVVSTMPLTDVVSKNDGFDEAAKKAAEKLKYRNTIIVYLLVNKAPVFSDNWIYIHDPNLQCGRITNFHNWSPDMLRNNEKTILAMEYWANDEDSFWRLPDDALVDIARKEIAATGLVNKNDIEAGHVEKLHRSYPVYARGYTQHLQKIQDAITAYPALTCIGRNGSFKYNNQDHSILMGLKAAEKILHNTDFDLWKINTDYDYQEKGKAIAK